VPAGIFHADMVRLRSEKHLLILPLIILANVIKYDTKRFFDGAQVLDFEPMFEILHSESCMKNQERGGPEGAWCMWLKLKPQGERRKRLQPSSSAAGGKKSEL
jgi:hypothetical protein